MSTIGKSLDLLECRVLPDGGIDIPGTAWGELDAARLQDFEIAVDDQSPLPESLHAKLLELAGDKQIQLVAPGAGCIAVIRYDREKKQVAFYSPDALPDGEGRMPPTFLNRKPLNYSGESDDEALAREILYVARIQRLMSLDNPAGPPMTVELNPAGAASTSAPPAAPASPDSGKPGPLPRLPAGRQFTLKTSNRSEVSLYAAVFTIDASGDVQLLYPQPGEMQHEIRPGATFEIGADSPFKTTYDPALARGGIETTYMKIIATNTFVDYTPLMVPPESGARNVRKPGTAPGGEADKTFRLVRDVLHGGPLSQAVSRGAGRDLPSKWATATIGFEVVPQ